MMRKNIFLLIVIFLVATGTRLYSQMENYWFNYYVESQTTTSLPSHIDANTLTNEDKAELANEEDEYNECGENNNLFSWDIGYFILNSDRDTRNFFIEEFFNAQILSEQDSIIIATYCEDGDSLNFVIDLKELTFERHYFLIGEDNPFFNEEGNTLWDQYHIHFIKTSEGHIIPEKEIGIGYGELTSGIPHAYIETILYLYYKIEDKSDTSIIVEVGDEELFNDCMGYTSITEAQEQKMDMNIYPNPAKERITVDLSSFRNENTHIEIFNTLGAVVFQQDAQSEQIEINVYSLPAGIYVIRCANENKIVSNRFVKQ